jgi:hypothetical protein
MTVRAHLVGSVNLANAQEVFKAASAAAGDALDRLPDGETGDRQWWIDAQIPALEACPQLDRLPDHDIGGYARPLWRVTPGVSAADIDLGPLGYVDAARGSYEALAELQRAGVVRADVRLQVSLPTSAVVALVFVRDDDRLLFEQAHERALRAEIGAMVAALPPGALALQWDVSGEMGMAEGAFPCYFAESPIDGTAERLARLSRDIPDHVQVGVHLCLGDGPSRRAGSPDAALLVAMANAIAERFPRRLDWVHMPVPDDRDSDAFMEPLADLSLPEGSQLFLGIVHAADGVEGAVRRAAIARRHVPDFGVAAECGMGRRPSEDIQELLALHGAVVAALS